MNREKIVFALLKPVDLALAGVVGAMKMTGTLPKVTDKFYDFAGVILRRLHGKTMSVEGLENVPKTGGVLFASNHQSWNDVQVLGASCPRRVRFLSKDEFARWPVLRHLIVLSDSPFIHRGGDIQAMAMAIASLTQGKALGIFPEGTIPGEEELMRHEVEPATGLLRGHTGAVRMAIAAKAPIVPVGISGTGAAFPPEIYPRLELLQAPKSVPVTVRYGKPLTFVKYYDKDLARETLHELTEQLMLAISKLVDHERNYIPLRVPIEPLPRYNRLGVLLLHGFTSSLKTVDSLVPHLEKACLPYRMPVLRGHCTKYTDLKGVTAKDWYADAEAALLDLAEEVDKVVVVGLSMGGLVALQLGMEHKDKIAGLVTLAAAMRFKDPLASASSLFAKLVKSWPSPNSFNDKSLKRNSTNYTRFATDAFASLYQYGRQIEKSLPELTVPLAVVQSKKDQIVDPVAANIIYHDVSSAHREIHWFTRSGHELGQDMEAAAVFARVMQFVLKFKKGV
jgi:carboxylesterase